MSDETSVKHEFECFVSGCVQHAPRLINHAFFRDMSREIIERISAIQSQLDEAEKHNDLFSNCLRRALKLWQDKHPEYEGWPDGAVNLAWVLDQYTEAKEENKQYKDSLDKIVRHIDNNDNPNISVIRETALNGGK